MAAAYNLNNDEGHIQRQMEKLKIRGTTDNCDEIPLREFITPNATQASAEFEYHGHKCSLAKEYLKLSKKSARTDKRSKFTVSGARLEALEALAGIASPTIGKVDADLAGDAAFGGADYFAGASNSFDTSSLPGAAGTTFAAGSTGATSSACAAGFTFAAGSAGGSGAAGFNRVASSADAAGLTGAAGSANNDFTNDPEFVELQEKIMRSFNNPVVRIFKLIESMHNYLKDEFPSTQPNYFPSDYVYEWPEKYTMPKTLSIKYQLQFAAKKLHKFNTRLRRILQRNQHFDYMRYKECDASLTSLEGLAQELDSIKDLDLRHENFEFKTDQLKALALTVEMLIQRINDQIREAHLLITVFNWEMDLEHRQSQTMIKERKKTLGYAFEMIKKYEEDELRKQDPEYQAALKAKYKLPAKYNLDDLTDRVAQYDDLWNEVLANPSMFYYNFNIGPDGLFPKDENKSETPKPRTVPPYQYQNKHDKNQMNCGSNNVPPSFNPKINLNSTERPTIPQKYFL